ncbi:hypothetical protein CKO28_16465 [Rhodovibrio sodomensis]|uniref:HPt domain-containing protein n=1 Tax=Rhodovibrio sodomensis TaxID=1088 RepID=A0ABS1DJF5_9PROT|nr:hypothetical protein [Rhodovibrio sodomensis]MBK1669633.1 hypothetical protein [Rhodovibrio sodomensis]
MDVPCPQQEPTPGLEADFSDLAAQITDADNAIEALRLVGNVVQDLDRDRLTYGPGGAQPEQLDALMHLVHQAQGHARRAREAVERCEQGVAADGEAQAAE